MLRKTFGEALNDVEDGTVDILHIDGRHFYDDVKEDFESWIPKLSARAVVLFHDTEVRDRGFGVWQYWAELETSRPSLNFPHQHGLGVLFWGRDIPEGLKPLLELAASSEGRQAVLEFFALQGEEFAAAANHRQLLERRARDRPSLRDLEAEVFRARSRPLAVVRNYCRFHIFRGLSMLGNILPNAAVKRFEKNARSNDPMRGLSGFYTYEEDILNIEQSGQLRRDFYDSKGKKWRSARNLIRHYVRSSQFTGTQRKPMPGFHPPLYSAHIGESFRGNAFSDFLARGRPEGPWLTEVLQGAKKETSSISAQLRVALHLHVFYPELVAEIIDRLQANATRPDLFVSCPGSKIDAVRDAFKTYEGRIIELQEVPNAGRDIGPLLTQFGTTLVAEYDIVGHIHTKKSVHFRNQLHAERWRNFLLENLIGGSASGKMMDTILAKMEADPTIGAVFPDEPNIYGWDSNLSYAEGLARRLGLYPLPEHFNFPAGTMFWMRKARLRRFVDLKLSWNDYPVEPIPLDGTMLHALERLFGVTSAEDGDRNVVTNVRGVTR